MNNVKHIRDGLSDMSALREEDSTSNWITSYSDLVTLLLCFFIMFFAIFSKKKIEDIRQKAVTAQEEKMKAMTNPKTIGLITEEMNEKFAKLEGVYSLVYEIPGIETVKKRDHFLIIFNDGNFFDPASIDLNMTGHYKMALVLERLLPHSDKIFIEVQGHADNTPVVNKYQKFRSNIELSAMRAISVYNYFKQFGFPEDNMSISGLSHHRPIIDGEEDEEAVMARNRRITFRVESK